MRKFLRQEFWSQGTPLGSLGPLSFEALGPGFDQCQILLIWGPYEYLDLVALQVQAEILKTIRSWCDSNCADLLMTEIMRGISILLSFLQYH